jgi:hypothetical protein
MSDVFPKEIELDEYFGDDMDRPLERGKSVPVRRVIDGMIKADLKNVLVLGWLNDDEMFVAASHSDKRNIIYLIERFKYKLLSGDYDSQ